MTDATMERENKSEIILRMNLIKYLDTNGILHTLEIEGFNLIESLTIKPQIFPIFPINIEVDILKLGAISDLTVKTLIREPIYFGNVLKETILFSMNTLLPNLAIQLEQIRLNLYLDPSNFISDFNTTIKTRIIPQGLVTTQIILTHLSNIQKHILIAVWCCRIKCNNGLVTTNGIPAHPPFCPSCGFALCEEARARDIEDRVLASGLTLKSITYSTPPKMYKSMNIIFKEKLTHDLQLGVAYNITGYMDYNGMFIALGLTRHVDYVIKSVLLPMPSTIVRLLSLLDESPYRFVHAIASQLGVEKKLVPENAFLHLKLGLLLSLCSLQSDEYSRPIHILAIGADTLTPHQLLSYVSRFAARRVAPLPADVITTSISREGGREAGVLPLTGNGVCYIGDWEKFVTNKSGFLIKSAIESGFIPTEGDNGINLPLKSAVWTYSINSNKEKDRMQLQALINVFGMPILSDAGQEEDIYIKHLLNIAINPNDNPVCTYTIPEEELKQFISMVNARSVRLTESTEHLLKEYFVAKRRDRPGSLPLRALNALASLAQSHARLSLRSETVDNDGIMAIWLLEQSVLALYPKVGLLPPNVPCENEQLDPYYNQFEDWLRQFINNNLTTQTQLSIFSQTGGNS